MFLRAFSLKHNINTERVSENILKRFSALSFLRPTHPLHKNSQCSVDRSTIRLSLTTNHPQRSLSIHGTPRASTGVDLPTSPLALAEFHNPKTTLSSNCVCSIKISPHLSHSITHTHTLCSPSFSYGHPACRHPLAVCRLCAISQGS